MTYVFTLDGTTAKPIYPDSLAINLTKESGQRFFRKALNGKLQFVRNDYSAILAQSFDHKFALDIDKYDDNGDWEDTVFVGYFYKSDCTIDRDSQVVEVTPKANDDYVSILDNMEKEFNLIDIAPVNEKIRCFKRPVIQSYIAGSTQLTNILSSMVWTQECDAISDYEQLRDHHHFNIGTKRMVGSVWGNTDQPNAPTCFIYSFAGTVPNYNSVTKDGWTLEVQTYGSGMYIVYLRKLDDASVWSSGPIDEYRDMLIELNPVGGSGFASGTFTLRISDATVFTRVICDTDNLNGVPTSPRESDDISGTNLNYEYVIAYAPTDSVYMQETLSTTPTKYGIAESGKYYVKPQFPAVLAVVDSFPICQDRWGDFSQWWLNHETDDIITGYGAKPFTLNDAYPLWSVISQLLDKIGSPIHFAGDAAHSEFFYGLGGGIRAAAFLPYITPKSNIVSSEYDMAAQRGNITLKKVFDMLRDCFRCYWFIDGGELRIEHVYFFDNGQSYTGTPSVGYYLNTMIYSRLGKSAATGQNKYKYNKPETYGRIQFGWMDDVTANFDGHPVDIISPFVNVESIEEITVMDFTSDIDYVMLNPSAVSKDGFMLLLPIMTDMLEMPIVRIDNGLLQNGYASFLSLVDYYMYDLPVRDYEIDGEAGTAIHIERLTEQEVTFPAGSIPDPIALVRTGLGDGRIEKLTYTLLSGEVKATLSYEQI